MDFSLSSHDVALLKTYAQFMFPDQNYYNLWKATSNFDALLSAWEEVLKLHGGDGLLFYDAIATPMMTQIDYGPEGSGSESYSRAETVGFTIEATPSFSVSEKAKASCPGVGDSITVTGSVRYADSERRQFRSVNAPRVLHG